MKLFFRHFGSGWPLIVIHGLYGSSDNWLSIAKRLEKHFSVYLLDMRNHGNSPHSNSHTYQDMAKDVHEFINDIGIKAPIILGHSMGGKVAMQFGLMYPELVHKMIIVDISPMVGRMEEHLNEHLKIIDAIKQLPLDELESRESADNLLAAKIQDKRTRNFLLKNLGRDRHHFFWKLNVQTIDESLHDIISNFDNNANALDQKIFPILFIKGNESDYIDIQDIPKIKKFYPEAKFETIHDAGHWVHAEQPEKLTNSILSFCHSESDFG